MKQRRKYEEGKHLVSNGVIEHLRSWRLERMDIGTSATRNWERLTPDILRKMEVVRPFFYAYKIVL